MGVYAMKQIYVEGLKNRCVDRSVLLFSAKMCRIIDILRFILTSTTIFQTKEIPRTRQDCRKVSENKCFNITIPEYGVRTQDRSQMVSVQLPRCQPRTEQATYCHNFPTGNYQGHYQV